MRDGEFTRERCASTIVMAVAPMTAELFVQARIEARARRDACYSSPASLTQGASAAQAVAAP